MYMRSSTNSTHSSFDLDAFLRATRSALRACEIDAPAKIARTIAASLSLPSASVFLVGGRGARSVVALTEGSAGYVARPDGHPCSELALAQLPQVFLETPDHWWSKAAFSPEVVYRLTRPITALLALCHPENFPLPRFALGIADMAAALRSNYCGQTFLMDMQLGATLTSMVTKCIEQSVDIVGVSVTFGQQDLLHELLTRLDKARPAALVIVGGSLATLNSRRIIDGFPKTLVAKGAGEATICDVVAYWRGECPVDVINNIEFDPAMHECGVKRSRGHGPVTSPFLAVMSVGTTISLTQRMTLHRTTHRVDDRASIPIPELDLLHSTLRKRGVMQLESSRGCTFACSFCPRDHKGTWHGEVGSTYQDLLAHVRVVYNRHPTIARRIFLVDEEFFGYRDSSEERVLAIANTLSEAGFTFETSARVDQVYRPRQDTNWHIRRTRVWRSLVNSGLRRCLFGLESGVDSILMRFRKKTTSRQNIVACRILSLAGVPVRLTYITFDPLMTMDELIESYRFQGRTDLWLPCAPNDDEGTIIRRALDDEQAAAVGAGAPLYSQIPYMLVSMECLIGSDYLRQVEEAGLARDENALMGRRDADFIDPIIGQLSRHAQMWIDRSFALDYTLKSVIKIMGEDAQAPVMGLRLILKDYAYRLLGMMLTAANDRPALAARPDDGIRALEIATLCGWTASAGADVRARGINAIMTSLFEEFVMIMSGAITSELAHIRGEAHEIVRKELDKWQEPREWSLING
jgi:radical SAM superfamily enzyme YgiQ (UPF0313 family)